MPLSYCLLLFASFFLPLKISTLLSRGIHISPVCFCNRILMEQMQLYLLAKFGPLSLSSIRLGHCLKANFSESVCVGKRFCACCLVPLIVICGGFLLLARKMPLNCCKQPFAYAAAFILYFHIRYLRSRVLCSKFYLLNRHNNRKSSFLLSQDSICYSSDTEAIIVIQ